MDTDRSLGVFKYGSEEKLSWPDKVAGTGDSGGFKTVQHNLVWIQHRGHGL